ncbi:MFS transporter [Kitasatospora sp. NPDC093806]|uniref:MFS transporter n=1 Tax=Kitasatospora sp. NPDC093806 TaxID=3155075 RepID=UPI0034256683
MTTETSETRPAPSPPPAPLARNRDYNILWTSRLCSELGFELALVGIPLLILAQGGSPLQMGAASSLLAAVRMAATLPAGVIADRWNRRRVMICCEGVRAVATGALALSLALGHYAFWQLVVLVVVEGAFGAVFGPAEHAALPQVVAAEQLPSALARNAARPFLATLLGPVAAGLLFTVHPTGPFTTTAVMLALSFATLLALRLPPRPAARPAAGPATGAAADADGTGEADPDGTGGARAALAGFRRVLRGRVIRASLLWMAAVNLLFNALLVVILARSGEDRIGPGQIGLMMACLGAGGLLGAVLAPRLYAALPPRVLVLGFAPVAAAATGLMVLVPAGIPLGLLLGVAAFLAPAANTAVLTYQLAVVPDELRGRLSAAAAFCSGAAGALGPLLGGLLTARHGGTATGVLACAAGLGLVAVAGLCSPALRSLRPTPTPVDPAEG